MTKLKMILLASLSGLLFAILNKILMSFMGDDFAILSFRSLFSAIFFAFFQFLMMNKAQKKKEQNTKERKAKEVEEIELK